MRAPWLWHETHSRGVPLNMAPTWHDSHGTIKCAPEELISGRQVIELAGPYLRGVGCMRQVDEKQQGGEEQPTARAAYPAAKFDNGAGACHQWMLAAEKLTVVWHRWH